MTVTQPDTPLCKAPACSREEDDDMPLGVETPAWTILARSSDDGSTTSVAFKETVCWANLKCPKWDEYDPELEMERSPPVQFNRGPPFAIGELCYVMWRSLVFRKRL